MIDVKNLTVRFGGVVALNNLTLKITDDVVGLIGPNGAGKTTLTNALSGFVTVASGSASVNGLNLIDMPPHQRSRWGLARSFQKVQIVSDLTVEDHLATVLDAKGANRSLRDKAIVRALDYTGIRSARRVLGADLNPFQRRLTEIAKCLVGAPRVILLDEPGGGLSETEMKELRKIILGIHPEFGAQILLVDHDVELIRDVCTSTAVLDFGKLIAYGPTGEVLEDEVVKAAYLGLMGTGND